MGEQLLRRFGRRQDPKSLRPGEASGRVQPRPRGNSRTHQVRNRRLHRYPSGIRRLIIDQFQKEEGRSLGVAFSLSFLRLFKDFAFTGYRVIFLKLQFTLNLLAILTGKVNRVRLGRLEANEVVL